MEKFIAFLKTLILMIFIFGIILIGSIDMDMTERNLRQTTTVTTSVYNINN